MNKALQDEKDKVKLEEKKVQDMVENIQLLENNLNEEKAKTELAKQEADSLMNDLKSK